MTASLNSGRAAALVCALVAFLAIATALVIEHGFGYAPCPLCLEQRWPYYIGVPAALVVAALAGRIPRAMMAVLLVALAGLFVWGMALGVYHAGAEWSFWRGPTDCAAGNSSVNPAEVGDLLSAIRTSTVVSCTTPALRILGISLAGWNAMVMAVLVVIALAGAYRARRSG